MSHLSVWHGTGRDKPDNMSKMELIEPNVTQPMAPSRPRIPVKGPTNHRACYWTKQRRDCNRSGSSGPEEDLCAAHGL
jgi:hypothetical protein